MKFKEIKLVGGVDSLKPSHNHSFGLIRLFDNLAPLGENKFVSELKRTYKFKRGVNRHTEDNSPKYRMVGNCYDKSSLRANAKQSSETGATHVVHWNNSRKIAFTLAEVLVTLGIIGVVSAMTVPTLMQNYQRQSYVTQLHKVYNELTQAFLQFKNDRNAIWLSEAGHVRHQDMMPFMKQYFKVVQDCGKTSTPCFASSYKNLSGSTFELTTKDEDATYYGVLASGASFGIKSDGIDTGTNYTDDFLYRIAIDVNGQKGPNIYGRDLFILYIFSDGVVDAYRVNPDCRENNNCTLGANPSEHREKLYESCASSTGNTWYDGCFAKILNDNWEMNY